MTKFDFSTPLERRGTNSLKWDWVPEDAIPMWLADMDFRASPAITQALTDKVEAQDFGYAMPLIAVAEIVAEYHLKESGWEIDPRWVVWLPNLVFGLNAVSATLASNKEVLVFTPIYPPFLRAPSHCNGKTISVSMIEENGEWVLDFKALEKAITPETKLLLFCNPQNPTGRVFKEDELERLVSICKKHAITICSDEVHAGLILDKENTHKPLAVLRPDMNDSIITLTSPGKTYNIAGLGISYAIVPDPKKRRLLERYALANAAYPNALAYSALEAAYRKSAAWRKELLDVLRKNRDILFTALKNELAPLKANVVQSTYLAWINTQELKLKDGVSAYEHFLKHGVALSDGKDFGMDGFLRLNFGCPEEQLLQAIKRMAKAIAVANT